MKLYKEPRKMNLAKFRRPESSKTPAGGVFNKYKCNEVTLKHSMESKH